MKYLLLVFIKKLFVEFCLRALKENQFCAVRRVSLTEGSALRRKKIHAFIFFVQWPLTRILGLVKQNRRSAQLVGTTLDHLSRGDKGFFRELL